MTTVFLTAFGLCALFCLLGMFADVLDARRVARLTKNLREKP